MDESDLSRYRTDAAYDALRDLIGEGYERFVLTDDEDRIAFGRIVVEASNRGFSAGVVDAAAQAIEQGVEVNLRQT